MAKRGRDLKKESRWRKPVLAQQRSGQTVRQYCRENGLTESAFWFWKRELARRAGEKPTRRPGDRPEFRSPRSIGTSPAVAGAGDDRPGHHTRSSDRSIA